MMLAGIYQYTVNEWGYIGIILYGYPDYKLDSMV